MTLREKIIVLKNIPFQESDLIIKGINEEGAQRSFIAKSALKSKKRFTGSVLEPGSYIALEYKKSRSSLPRLNQAWFLESFPGLRSEYARLDLALYFLKLIYFISQEGAEDAGELFHLLGNALREAEKSTNLKSLKLFFEMKVLYFEGALPLDLKEESILKSKLKDHESFNIKNFETLPHKIESLIKSYIS